MKHLALIFAILLISTGVWADGTEPTENPRQVTTLDNLLWISTNSSSWGDDFIQTANINASTTVEWNSGYGFAGIGSYSNKFTGNYNGQGYTIDGLQIHRINQDNIGFFGYTNSATIQNVNLTDVYIRGHGNVGALVGCSDNSTYINCSSSGYVSTSTSSVGGLIGSVGSSNISRCHSSCEVRGTNYYSGGLTGYNNAVTITNCYTTGIVDGGSHYQGGLAGGLGSSTSITNCYSTSQIKYYYNPSTNYIGGLVGYRGSSAVNNSFWDTQTSGLLTSNGGTGKTTTEMKNVATFTDETTVGLTTAWDFETNPNDDDADNNYWDMTLNGSINNGYPYLSWEDGEDVSLPVEISSFTIENQNSGILLKWTTESEIENLGFILERQCIVGANHDLPSSWSQIVSYTSDDALTGYGSTSEKHDYQFTDKAVQPGVTYEYRLGDVDYNGKVTWHKTVEITVDAESVKLPVEFGLHKAYPNPFNPSVILSYGLKDAGQTTLQVYNMRGQMVETLVSTNKLVGNYNFVWQPVNLSAGVYIVRLQSGNQTNLQKIVFVK